MLKRVSVVKKLGSVFKRVRLTFYTFKLFELHEIQFCLSEFNLYPNVWIILLYLWWFEHSFSIQFNSWWELVLSYLLIDTKSIYTNHFFNLCNVVKGFNHYHICIVKLFVLIYIRNVEKWCEVDGIIPLWNILIWNFLWPVRWVELFHPYQIYRQTIFGIIGETLSTMFRYYFNLVDYYPTSDPLLHYSSWVIVHLPYVGELYRIYISQKNSNKHKWI